MKGVAGAANNHPGDAVADSADAFTYSNVAKLSADASTTATVLGPLGGDNRGYLMPERHRRRPRGPPSRETTCPSVSSVTRTAASWGRWLAMRRRRRAFLATLDGSNPSGSPRFQNFPHETQNAHFLVETNDNLCLNCHTAE